MRSTFDAWRNHDFIHICLSVRVLFLKIKGVIRISIILKTEKWGVAEKADVLKVLNFTKKIMDSFFNRSFPCDIFVYQKTSGSPRTLFDKSPSGAYQINLNVTDTYWSQYVYQFSHEYCHVRTNHCITNSRTQWFEEVVCELASICALREMAKAWKIKPPYPHWENYAESLSTYAENILSDPLHKIPSDVSFDVWFKGQISLLEKDPYMRDSNTIIAIELLPIFDAYPSIWNSITYWHGWGKDEGSDIQVSMQRWLDLIPLKNKSGAEAVAAVFVR